MLSGGLAAYKRARDKRFSFFFRSPPFAFSPPRSRENRRKTRMETFFSDQASRASKRNETPIRSACWLARSLASTAIFLSFSSRSIGYSPSSRQPAVTHPPLAVSLFLLRLLSFYSVPDLPIEARSHDKLGQPIEELNPAVSERRDCAARFSPLLSSSL